MLKIAVDNQVAMATVKHLEHKGVVVVLRACHEPDEVWTAEALDLGAQVFVSPDWDIACIARKNSADWIKFPQGMKGIEAAHYIMSELCKINQKKRVAA